MNETNELTAQPGGMDMLPPVVETKPALNVLAITPQQSRIEAVADLTKSAMSKAGTLVLTPEETKSLTADFGDADFRTGASGKENLIYIEHAALRDRLNTVLGLGQWAIIVRESWNEDYTTAKGARGVKVYARAMLLVRGCYVAEAVGDMDYFPSNGSQNFGDAFEGAKTAAFRRCAKEFGVGLQAWRKDWCDAWWARKNGKPAGNPVQLGQPTPRAAAPAVKHEPKPVEPEDQIPGAEVAPAGTRGNIEQTSRKEGVSKSGKPYTKFGVKIDGVWFNTFSETLYDIAENLKGTPIVFTANEGKFGNDLLTLSPADAEYRD